MEQQQQRTRFITGRGAPFRLQCQSYRGMFWHCRVGLLCLSQPCHSSEDNNNKPFHHHHHSTRLCPSLHPHQFWSFLFPSHVKIYPFLASFGFRSFYRHWPASFGPVMKWSHNTAIGKRTTNCTNWTYILRCLFRLNGHSVRKPFKNRVTGQLKFIFDRFSGLSLTSPFAIFYPGKGTSDDNIFRRICMLFRWTVQKTEENTFSTWMIMEWGKTQI